MEPIDAITALGRLLRDGRLRDAYATEPRGTLGELGVVEAERHALLSLDPASLEFQAQILLRKRFETISRLVPLTLANLGERGWPLFAEYARSRWPGGKTPALEDVDQFTRRLRETNPQALSMSEQNRLRFALSRASLSVCFALDLPFRGRRRAGLQVFVRRQAGPWRELVLHLAF